MLHSDGAYIDGGLAFGPTGVLFVTRYPTNELGEVRLLEPEPLHPAVHQPTRMGRDRGDVADRIGIAPRRLWRSPRFRQTAQHRVRISRRTSQPDRSDELHALVHRGVRGHARVMQQLERGDPQRGTQRRIQVGWRPIAVGAQSAIELQLPSDRAVRQLGAKRDFPRIERACRPERAVESEVGESSSLFDAQKHLRSQPARRGNRHARLLQPRSVCVHPPSRLQSPT